MPLLTFLLPALALCALSVALVVLAWRRGAPGAEAARREQQVYRDQIAALDGEIARGLVTEAEAERLRTEIARRLLDSDKSARTHLTTAPARARGPLLATIAAVPLVAAGVYWMAGAPLFPDQPLAQRYQAAAAERAARPDQITMEAEWQADPSRPDLPPVPPGDLALIEQLRTVVAARPDDEQGLTFLASAEDSLGNHAAAAQVWEQLARAQGAAVDAEVLASLARSMIFAAGGRVSPQAEAVLERALARDPQNGGARYYLGLSFLQTGRPDLTFRLWRGLLADSPPDAPWVPVIRDLIEELAQIAGVRYTLPPLAAQGGRGPSAEDLEAARDMTDAERAEMIGGMVEGLSARLANQGGSAQEWAQLINALGVLGQLDRARAIWSEARLAFADRPDDRALVDQAARGLGFLD